MISGKELYVVLTAVVPLYVAMILAYGAVRWWKIFTPDQCSGINRFVAVFAVPFLSFNFISQNNLYTMNFRFIAADTLQKLIMLFVLAAWANFTKNGSLEWSITFFSLSTLPNTLVMGIPLFIAMYGEFSGSLMVQIIVFQCIVWYTLLLFLFEYRGAKMLISEQFPKNAGSIVSFEVDPDVVSLDGQDFIETDTEIANDGKLHVVVRKSNASRRSLTRQPSNLTEAEIYRVGSSRNATPIGSNINHSDFHSMMGMGRLSNFGNSDTGRMSNFNVVGEHFSVESSTTYPAPSPEIVSPLPKTQLQGDKAAANHNAKDLHLYARSSSASPPRVSEGAAGSVSGSLHVFSGLEQSGRSDPGPRLLMDNDDNTQNGEGVRHVREDMIIVDVDGAEKEKEVSKVGAGGAGKHMPPASVMIRLIMIMVWRKLIRNPNSYSSIIGLIWSLISFRWNVHLPKIIDASIKILSNAGLGMAMFSLGLFMALQPKMIPCGKRVATFAMAVRFLAGPAVMAAASIAVGLRGTILRIAIVQAALPQAIVPFVFAKEYNVHAQILSTAVIFGMLVALPITLVYYILLGL